jgi:hypothetical protein
VLTFVINRTKHGLLIVGLAGLLVATFFFTRKPQSGPTPSVEASTLEKTADLTVVRDSRFETEFGSPMTGQLDDLAIVRELLASSRLLVKEHAQLPLADNQDFVKFLSGGNPHHVAWIPPGHPSVSKSGELLDRWGRAVIFHQESSSHTSLRSAGPDGIPWNHDDLTLDELGN